MSTDLPTWHARAACRDLPLVLFFPGMGRRPVEALEVCEGCPVLRACLDSALALPSTEDYGVRGGTTEGERAKMRRERKRSAA